MEFATIPETPLKISRVGLGTWAIGGWMWGGTDDDESITTIHAAVERGVNLIDTAPAYGFGRSEEIVGRAIAEGAAALARRDRHQGGARVERTESSSAMPAATAFCARSRTRCGGCAPTTSTSIRSIGPIRWCRSKRLPKQCRRSSTRGRSALLASAISRLPRSSAFAASPQLHVVQPPYNLFEREIESRAVALLPDNRALRP